MNPEGECLESQAHLTPLLIYKYGHGSSETHSVVSVEMFPIPGGRMPTIVESPVCSFIQPLLVRDLKWFKDVMWANSKELLWKCSKHQEWSTSVRYTKQNLY